MEADPEVLKLFLEESTEDLDRADRDLVELEKTPNDPELLARVFRTVHTIKGTTGFLGFTKLQTLANSGENLLGALREHRLPLDQQTITSLLALMDALRASVIEISATGAEGELEHSAIIADLAGYFEQSKPPIPEPAPSPALAPALPPVLPPAPPPVADTALVPPPATPHPLSTGTGSLRAEVSASADSSVRVGVAVLDSLMDLVSELVVIRSQIEVISSDDPDTPMATSGRQLRLVTRELQDQVMKARLQPIGVVTGRLRRLARDVGAELGKRVQVALEGEDIAVDRAVNEALRDPLLHLVRNCVDHGLESATERAAVGKPAVGSLRVAVRHSHGRVYVDVSDDGRGMDPVALARRAVRIGLISEDRADRLSEREALDLVFLPGFTTADQVTNVSGRGVGMDVVRSNLQRIGGSIEIRSTIGVGTSFRLNVPLTLAIMPVLTVWCGGQRYAVPQVSVREIRRVRGDDVEQAPDDIEGALIYRIRGHLLPSVDLAALLKVPPDHEADQLLVLLESDQRQFAVLVAAVGDTTDVVAKPLPRSVGGVSAFAGVSIYGDGCPVLILDVDWIANISGITVSGGQAEPTPATAVREDTVLLLLACAEDGGQLVLPLDRVLRLENFDQDQVERLGDLDVVQYRDDILPLVRVRDVLPERRASPRDLPARPQTSTLATVVCASQVGAVGIVVGGIEDIVKTSDAARRPASRAGVLSCLVVADRVAELLDIDALAALAGVRRTS